MAHERIVAALEIGTSKICLAIGRIRPDGTVKVDGIRKVPSCGVRKGEIVDLDSARQCVHDVIAEAEKALDIEINSTYLAITGAHISSFNLRGVINLPETHDEIVERDLEELRANAIDGSIPADNKFLHDILQHYRIDGQDGVLNPIGMTARTIEAEYHVIHGVGSRIMNSMRCVEEVPVEIDDVVFAPYAAANVALSDNAKKHGALMLDIGGGTTDYILYADGVVKQSGTIAVGGDHITNDISLGLRIPVTRAEKLKVEEASVLLGNCLPGESIILRDEPGFAGKEVEREKLNLICHLRVREILELVHRRLAEPRHLDQVTAGITLTGGSSLLRGIPALTQSIFDLPVTCGNAEKLAGVTGALEDPRFSVVIGLLRYAEAAEADAAPTSIFSRILGAFGRRNR